MTLRIQIIFLVFLIIVMFLIVSMVRKRTLDLKYVLLWMASDIALIIVTAFPDLLGGISSFLGIRSPMNMIFFLGFLFLLAIMYSLTVALSKTSSQLRKIAQYMALDKYEKEKFDGLPDESEEMKTDRRE